MLLMPGVKMYIKPTQQKPMQNAGKQDCTNGTLGGFIVNVQIYGYIGWAQHGSVSVCSIVCTLIHHYLGELS